MDVLTIFFGPKIHEFSDRKWSSVDGISEGGVPDSNIDCVQSPFEMLHKVTSFSCPGYSLNAFLGGCTPNCPSHGCTPLQFKSTSHGCQKSKCLFLNLITFCKHFQTIIFSMQVEFRAWNPPPIWGLGEWLLAQAVYFALEICIYVIWRHLQSYLVDSFQIGSSFSP